MRGFVRGFVRGLAWGFVWGFARVALAAAAAAVLGAPAAAQTPSGAPGPPFGPLRVMERNPLYRLFLTPVAQTADLVGQGRVRVDWSFSYSNIFETSESEVSRLYFDLERMTNLVTVRVGVLDDVELGARLGWQTNWGGFLDRFILRFHEFFGFPSGERGDVANGSFGLLLRQEGLDPVNVPSGSLQEDLRLFAGWRAVGEPDSRRALTLRASAKLPTGSPAAGTGHRDVALEIDGRWSWERTHLHGSLGVVALAPPSSLARYTSHRAATYVLGVERQVADHVSWGAQLMGSSRYVGGFGTPFLDRIPLELALGASGAFGGGWLWQSSLTEDVLSPGSSVDFTLDLQLGRVW